MVPYESAVALAERLNQLTPGTHAKKTAFFTTGAEAVENAIKIARASTRRPGVIALSGAFHGRTFMGMALTGKVAPYKTGFGPFPGSIYHVPAPVPLHGVTVEIAAPRSSSCSSPTSIPSRWPRSSSSRCRAKAAST